MTDEQLRDARDEVWDALGATPVRRAMLGRERCDAIVRVAMEAHDEYAGRSQLGRLIEARVRERYRDRLGVPFMTLVVWWAISAIVQALVARWWSQEGQS